MRILLTAATALEIKPVIEQHPNLDVLITGVGVPMAIWNLRQRLQQMDYDLVLQAGIAGSFHSGLQPGDLVLVESDCFGDLAIYERGNLTPIAQTGLADADAFPFTKGKMLNPAPNPFQWPYPLVKAVTVNTVTDDRLLNTSMYKTYKADIETMEGAALHLVCLQLHQPFIQLRCISNAVGVRDKSQWQLEKAVQQLSGALNGIPQHFLKKVN